MTIVSSLSFLITIGILESAKYKFDLQVSMKFPHVYGYLFVCAVILIVFTIRLDLRKAFEVTEVAEKSAQTITKIINTIPDSIL